MKIAVIGAGAIGSIVAAYLAKAGEDVVLAGRPDHVAAIEKDGLSVDGVRGAENFKLRVRTRLSEAPDLVIFATKSQDLADAYQKNNAFLDNALVLTTQNGVQADNLLSTHFDREKMFSSIVMFGSTYIKPGHVTFNFEGGWIVGKPYMPVDPKTHEIASLLEKAFKVTVSMDIMGMKWLKLFINFNNCIPALVGKSMQETFADLELCRLSVLLLREGLHVVQSAKIELVSLPDFPKEKILGLAAMPVEQAAGILNKTLSNLSKEPLYGSILQSIMRGKPSEIDFINGEVVALAKHFHLASPLNARVVDMVHEVERSGRYFLFNAVKQELEVALKGKTNVENVFLRSRN